MDEQIYMHIYDTLFPLGGGGGGGEEERKLYGCMDNSEDITGQPLRCKATVGFLSKTLLKPVVTTSCLLELLCFSQV